MCFVTLLNIVFWKTCSHFTLWGSCVEKQVLTVHVQSHLVCVIVKMWQLVDVVEKYNRQTSGATSTVKHNEREAEISSCLRFIIQELTMKESRLMLNNRAEHLWSMQSHSNHFPKPLFYYSQSNMSAKNIPTTVM